eukprot:205405_1
MASCKLLVALFVLSNFDNYCLVGADTLEELITGGNDALKQLGLPLILTAESKSKVLFIVVCDKPICTKHAQVNDLSVAQLDKFWMPFLLGCKQDVLKKWFEDNTESETMGSAAGSSTSASNPTESAKEIVTEWEKNKKPEDTITFITPLIPGKYCNFAK